MYVYIYIYIRLYYITSYYDILCYIILYYIILYYIILCYIIRYYIILYYITLYYIILYYYYIYIYICLFIHTDRYKHPQSSGSVTSNHGCTPVAIHMEQLHWEPHQPSLCALDVSPLCASLGIWFRQFRHPLGEASSSIIITTTTTTIIIIIIFFNVKTSSFSSFKGWNLNCMFTMF